MRTRSSFLLLLLAGTAGLFSCKKSLDKQSTDIPEIASVIQLPPTCGTTMVQPLNKGFNEVAIGTVEVSNDGTNYYIKVTETDPNANIAQIRWIYGAETDVRTRLFGLFNCGAQAPSNPHLTTNYSPEVSEAYITVPIASVPGDCIYIHVHVLLVYRDVFTHQIIYSEWAWNNGTVNASQQNCQEYFQYCKQTCTPPDCGQLRTQTQGGWGAEPNGNNPGTYLHANFAAAFPAPNYLKVGCAGGYTITMTSAQAITDLLPTGGTPAVLTGNATNPASIKNVLVGQLIALSLSVRFDAYDPDFGQGGVKLGDMIIGSGPFAGKTVSQFLVIANNVLGGCSNAYTPQQVNETATRINENYVDGKADNGFLNCPETPQR